MSFLSNVALRSTTGAFILNSGLGKLNADEETYKWLQDMGSKAVPSLSALSPTTFGKGLAYSEIALGSALLCPVVTAKIAGLGLTAFSAGLLTMYLNDDSLTLDDGVRPSQEGVSYVKDIAFLGSGLALALSRKKK